MEGSIKEAFKLSLTEEGLDYDEASRAWRLYNFNRMETHGIARELDVDIAKANLMIDGFTKFSKMVKGEKDGLCNRGACQTPEDVIFFNKSTRKYYCPECAFQINKACRPHELESLFGEGTKFLCLTDDGREPRGFWRDQMEERREYRKHRDTAGARDNVTDR